MPNGDGRELVRALRVQNQHIGTVIFIARGAMQDKLSGISCGADHSLPKHPDLDELAAPLASLRRLRRKTKQATGLSLSINTARNTGCRFFANAPVRR